MVLLCKFLFSLTRPTSTSKTSVSQCYLICRKWPIFPKVVGILSVWVTSVSGNHTSFRMWWAMGFWACEFPVLPSYIQRLPAALCYPRYHCCLYQVQSLMHSAMSKYDRDDKRGLLFCDFAFLLVMVPTSLKLWHCCAVSLPLSLGF